MFLKKLNELIKYDKIMNTKKKKNAILIYFFKRIFNMVVGKFGH